MRSYGDPDDEWSRLRRALNERKTQIMVGMAGGTLDYPGYKMECGRVDEIDATLQLITTIRKGEDIRPPVRERLLSPEE